MDFSFAVCCRIFLLTNCNCCRASLLPGSSFNTCSKSSLALSRSSTATRAWKQTAEDKFQGQMNFEKKIVFRTPTFFFVQSCGVASIWLGHHTVSTQFPLNKSLSTRLLYRSWYSDIWNMGWGWMQACVNDHTSRWMKSHFRACSARGTFCVNNNPVKRPGSPGVLVAQWLEHTNGVTEGSIPTWNSKILFSSSFTRCHATTICLLKPLKKSLSTGKFNVCLRWKQGRLWCCLLHSTKYF